MRGAICLHLRARNANAFFKTLGKGFSGECLDRNKGLGLYFLDRSLQIFIEMTERRKAYIIGGVKRSEEHTSELQSLMRISYAVFCLKKKKINNNKSY